MKTRSPRTSLVALTAAAALVGVTGCQGGEVSTTDSPSPAPAAADHPDHEEMLQRANDVMPFDLTTTTHTFVKTDTGGVQEVVAHDAADDDTVTAIRSHMAHEVDAFEAGDFSDPAAIHGHDMDGLAELEAGAEHLEAEFEEILAGGRITYTATEPDLLEALHAWFDQQVSDHSLPGMGG